MYAGVAKIFVRYWVAYGGWRALVRSPYLHLSLVLLALTSNLWQTKAWWDTSISVLPNLLGFSLGGFAVFLAFGDDKFRALIAQKCEDELHSPYLELCSSFVHFIFIQFLALLAAIIAKALEFDSIFTICLEKIAPIFHGLGFLLFLYSLALMMAATLMMFRTCSWYEHFQKNKPPPNP